MIDFSFLEVTDMQRYAAPGQCLASVRYKDTGTLGVCGIDRRTGKPVAITAMHVIPGIVEYPTSTSLARIELEAPCAATGGSLLGRLLRGTMTDIDACIISIDPPQVPSRSLKDIGPVEYWRAVDRSDRDRVVRMYGAASNRVNVGRILRESVHAPDWGIARGILVQMSARPGDSGAALVDEDNFLLGLLIGGTSTRQLFCPIEAIFDRLDCNLY